MRCLVYMLQEVKANTPTGITTHPLNSLLQIYGALHFSKGIVAETVNRARPGTESGGRAGSEITFPSLLYVVIFVIVDFII